MAKKLTTKDFIEKAVAVHGDKYDYSKSNYVDSRTKIEIICKKCGESFFQTPNNHLSGKGCSCTMKNKKLDQEGFIERAKKVHGDSYDYSNIHYVNSQTKVEIICKKCGNVFLQLPAKHISGQGCPICGEEKAKVSSLSNLEDFIEKAKDVHGDRYDYSKSVYTKAKAKIEITCKKCGKSFLQTANSHLNGKGCPFCRESRGEVEVGKILEKYNINYETQKKFNDCKYKMPLPFDFFIPSKNVAIEYDGEQHYKPVKAFGGDDTFNIQRKRDTIKNDFCKENNIKLVRISYKEFNNIENILKKSINL